MYNIPLILWLVVFFFVVSSSPLVASERTSRTSELRDTYADCPGAGGHCVDRTPAGSNQRAIRLRDVSDRRIPISEVGGTESETQTPSGTSTSNGGRASRSASRASRSSR